MSVIAQERMWLTQDKKKLVPDGDKKAATLYCAKGDLIPDQMVRLFSITHEGFIKGSPASKKQSDQGEDKSRSGGENKSRGNQ